MLVKLWLLSLVIKLSWGQHNRNAQETSCVKAGDYLYIIGGKVYINDWIPLKYIYRVKLNSLNDLLSIGDIWDRASILGYTPRSFYSTAVTIPGADEIFYYGGESLGLNDISLKYIDTHNLISNNIEFGPKERIIQDRFDISESKITISHSSLLLNDKKPSEVILIGGKVSKNEDDYIHKMIDIYDMTANSWSAYSAELLTGEYYISAAYKGEVYVFGPGIDIGTIPGGYRIPENDRKSKLILGKFSSDNRKWEQVLSVGYIPEFIVNYTFTQEKHLVYLVGENEGSGGIVYVLNLFLSIPKWIKVEQGDFSGYTGGCLTFHNDQLFHYFGRDNMKGTQKIDTTSWVPEAQFDKSKSILPDSQNNHVIYIIVLSSILGLFVLGLIINLIYRYRKRQNKIRPPDLYSGHILCEPPFILIDPQSYSLQSSNSTDDLNSQLFEINELRPDECFHKNLTYSTHPSKTDKTKRQ